MSKLDTEKEANDRLPEMLRLYIQKRFGPSSEKWNQDQLQILNEGEAESGPEDGNVESPEEVEDGEPSAPSSEKKPRKKGRRPLPDWLDRREVIHDLPEEEKVCPNDGSHVLRRIGEETSEQLEYIPATLQVIRNVRPKYAGLSLKLCNGPVNQPGILPSKTTWRWLSAVAQSLTGRVHRVNPNETILGGG